MQRRTGRRTVANARFPHSIASCRFNNSFASNGHWYKLTTGLWKFYPNTKSKIRSEVIYEPPARSNVRIYKFDESHGFVQTREQSSRHLFMEYTEKGPELFFAGREEPSRIGFSHFPRNHFVEIDERRARAYVGRDKANAVRSANSLSLITHYLVSFRTHDGGEFIRTGKGVTDYPNAKFFYPMSPISVTHPLLRLLSPCVEFTRVSSHEVPHLVSMGRRIYSSYDSFDFGLYVTLRKGYLTDAKEFYVLKIPPGSHHTPDYAYEIMVRWDNTMKIA